MKHTTRRMFRRDTALVPRHAPARTEPSAAGFVAAAAAGLAAGLAAGWMLAGVGRGAAGDLRGRVVLITGGSRGLGFVLAQECARRGAHVAICARDRFELSRAQAQIAASGRSPVFALACDITDRSAVERMVQTVQSRLGPIDVLINNAGILTLGPFQTMTLEDFDDAMRAHFWGPLYATMAVLPQMRARPPHGRGEALPGRRGCIVNISSIGGKIGVPHLAPYCASKFALQGLSESLHAELAGAGIQVLAVCPGIMRTGGHLNAAYKGRHRAEYAWMSALHAPGFSVSAERAARRIVEAMLAGRREIIIGLPARLADKAHGAAPELFLRLVALLARLLPAPGGIGRAAATGMASESRFVPGVLRRPMYRIGRRHNQFAQAGESAMQDE